MTVQRTVLWIVGEPGIGKTTLARALLAIYSSKPTWENKSPKFTGFGRACAPGYWRGGMFDGADTLGIGEIKPAMIWWRDELPQESIDLTVIDGDKLSNDGAVNVAIARARLICLWLHGSDQATERRLKRGSTQNETWVLGRKTKARKFYARFPGTKLGVHASFYTETQLNFIVAELSK